MWNQTKSMIYSKNKWWKWWTLLKICELNCVQMSLSTTEISRCEIDLQFADFKNVFIKNISCQLISVTRYWLKKWGNEDFYIKIRHFLILRQNNLYIDVHFTRRQVCRYTVCPKKTLTQFWVSAAKLWRITYLQCRTLWSVFCFALSINKIHHLFL